MNFIITGHGHFASGLQSSVKLITGFENALVAVDFKDNMSSDNLRDKLSDQLKINGKTEPTIIFTDIAGGTPFNQSVLLKNDNDNIEVLAGINLPVLIEAVLSQEGELDVLINHLIGSGKDSIKKYDNQRNKKVRDQNLDDGI